jgi:LmbE family N-acetylglucosaminyl deacetylase
LSLSADKTQLPCLFMLTSNEAENIMLMESALIPYTTSEIPKGPWLAFAPHADDETFGLGGSLLLASQQNIDTHVAFVTDGALGGSGDQTALIQKSIQEATDATTALGVKSIHFFGEPDRSLRVCQRLINKISKLIEEINPQSIFIPTPLEYHPDHRATTELVWQSVQSLDSFSGDVYAYEVSNLAPINLLIDTSAVAAQKYEVVKMYASQLTEAKYLDLVKAVDTARTFSLPMDRIAAEGFFKFAIDGGSIEEQLLNSMKPFFEDL